MSAIAMNVLEFAAHASELITNLKRDEEIILTNNDNQAVAKLIAINEQATEAPEIISDRRQLGLTQGYAWMSPDFNEPLEDFAEYMP